MLFCTTGFKMTLIWIICPLIQCKSDVPLIFLCFSLNIFKRKSDWVPINRQHLWGFSSTYWILSLYYIIWRIFVWLCTLEIYKNAKVRDLCSVMKEDEFDFQSCWNHPRKNCVCCLNGPANASAAAFTVSWRSVDGTKHKENHDSETVSCMWE